MPFVFSGIYLSSKKENGNCIKKALLLGTILMYAFVNMVVPIVQNNSNSAGFLYTYLTDRTEKVNAEFYYKCIVICMLVIIFAFLLFGYKKTRLYAIVPIFCLMIWGYHQANENYNAKITEKASAMVLASYEKNASWNKKELILGRFMQLMKETLTVTGIYFPYYNFIFMSIG